MSNTINSAMTANLRSLQSAMSTVMLRKAMNKDAGVVDLLQSVGKTPPPSSHKLNIKV